MHCETSALHTRSFTSPYFPSTDPRAVATNTHLLEMILKVSLTQMSARACVSPLERSSHRDPEGWTLFGSLCSQLIINTDSERRQTRPGSRSEKCCRSAADLRCVPCVTPSLPENTDSPAYSEDTQRLNVHTARSWLLLHHCNVHTHIHKGRERDRESRRRRRAAHTHTLRLL